MKDFIVSARKYRPDTFKSVVGQDHITMTLKNAIKNNQLAQAFLFTGTRGVGKTTCARILAKTINCQNLTDDLEPCNKCDSCKDFNEGKSFNIHELDAASNNSVEDIRSLIDKVRFAPQVGKFSVYIIDEVHMLSQSAFNAFLKTLEEPPSFAKFILATTEKHKILPTILSRCQIFDFNRITVIDIANHLKYVAESEKISAEEEALHIIAQRADGAMRDALSIFDQIANFSGNVITYDSVIQNLNMLDYNYYFKIVQLLYNNDMSNILLTYDEILRSGFEGNHFINGLADHFRNILVSKDVATITLLQTTNQNKEKFKDLASQATKEQIIKVLDILNKCDVQYKIITNKRLHVELAMLQICQVFNTAFEEKKKSNIEEKKTETNNTAKNTAQKVEATIAAKPVVNLSPTNTIDNNIITSETTKPTINVGTKYNYQPQTSIKAAENKEAPKEEKVIVNQNLNNNNFIIEDLVKYWQLFAEEIKPINPLLFITLTNQNPAIKDGFVIEFVIDNIVQENQFKEIASELLNFLRNNLKNELITINAVVKVQGEQQQYKPFNPKEKYIQLVEKNNQLDNLRKALELDLY
ncbi:MAG: DNA polymerase III, subunit gamma and tau [Bacteroidetes bacterium GWE2_29_8]|nr:MAG: DNA polymerase III, subunit gamma and tau [Bacteroidetes bacterium GWE2_29_8]OFY24483.1 MAG: DNA polymerase III, subunit gamma and tau [Bacteroidetes bacterium GWF2_29_10]